MPDNVVVADTCKKTTITDKFTAPQLAINEVTSVYYTITPSFDGNPALTAKATNSWIFGEKEVPYSQDLSFDPYGSTYRPLSDMFAYNANNDKYVWANASIMDYSTWQSLTGVLLSGPGGAIDLHNSADDWLITPSFKLEEGKYYEFSVNVNLVQLIDNYPKELIRACVGTVPTVDGMNKGTEVIPVTEINKRGDNLVKGGFVCKKTGYYYYGLQCCSEANTAFLLFTNMSVGSPKEVTAPAAPTNMTVIPDENGGGSAYVCFNVPTVDIVGNPVENISAINVYRNGDLIGTVTSGIEPGQPVKFIDNDAPVGSVLTYSIAAVNNDGEGLSAQFDAFVGITIPGAAENIDLSEVGNTGVVNLNWDEPKLDSKGYLLPTHITTYNIYDKEQTLKASNVYDRRYTQDFGAEYQGWEYFWVQPQTAAGTGEEATSNQIYVGKPYEFPFIETMNPTPASGKWGQQSQTIMQSGLLFFCMWMSAQVNGLPQLDDNGYVFSLLSLFQGGTASFQSPKVIIPADAPSPALSFYYFNQQLDRVRNTNVLNVMLCIDGGEWTQVKSIEMAEAPSSGWNKFELDLAEYKGHTVQVGFEGVANCYETLYPGISLMVDHIKIGNSFERDLCVSSISVPEEIPVNEKVQISTFVFNEGSKSQGKDTYDVTLYRNDQLVASQPGTIIRPGMGLNFTFDDVVSVTDGPRPKYYVVVECAEDEDLSNNASTVAEGNLIQTPYPTTELSGNISQEGFADLSWIGADWTSATGERISDDFENYEPWAGIDTGLGDWTLYDEDENYIGGINGMEWENLDTKQGFFVLDMDESGLSANGTFAHSGNKVIASMFDGGMANANNDWIVSTELVPDGVYELRFWARSISASYPEEFEVLVSDTDKEVASFTKVLLQADVVPEAWTEFSVLLPEGTKYFAIRCVSNRKFLFMLDDISCEPLVLDLKGYNLYRDGIRLNENPMSEVTYLDDMAELGERAYNVSVVWSRGESEPSNTVRLVVTDTKAGVDETPVATATVAGEKGYISIVGAEGLRVEVYNAAGIALYRGAGQTNMKVSAQPGVYVVRVDGADTTVLVK